MIRILIAINVFFICLSSSSQPKNYSTIPSECKNYIFNFDKVKIKLKESDVRFRLSELDVMISDSSFTPWYGCEKYIPIEFDENPSVAIDKLLKQSYPKLNSTALELKLRVSQWKVLHNLLPTENPRMYLSMDFFMKNIDGEYQLAYSSTEFMVINSGQNLEKPFGRLVGRSIKKFFKFQTYRNSLVKTDSSTAGDGLFTSFNSMKKNSPDYKMTFEVEQDTSDAFKSKFYLVTKENERYNDNIFGFIQGGRNYLNVNYYYPKAYFTEVIDLTEEYYFIYDQIYDYTKASSTTAVTGGGLLGAAIGSAAGNSKSPALIDKNSGQIKSFKRKELRKIIELSEYSYDEYEMFEKNKDLNSIQKVFKSLIESGLITSISPDLSF